MCLRLGRGCKRPQVSLARCLRPPQTHNRSGVRSEEYQTSPRSDYQRRLLCLSVGEKSPTVQLVKIVQIVLKGLVFLKLHENRVKRCTNRNGPSYPFGATSVTGSRSGSCCSSTCCFLKVLLTYVSHNPSS